MRGLDVTPWWLSVIILGAICIVRLQTLQSRIITTKIHALTPIISKVNVCSIVPHIISNNYKIRLITYSKVILKL